MISCLVKEEMSLSGVVGIQWMWYIIFDSEIKSVFDKMERNE